jgi:hypothetical protein
VLAGAAALAADVDDDPVEGDDGSDGVESARAPEGDRAVEVGGDRGAEGGGELDALAGIACPAP